MSLPIYELEPELVARLRETSRVIVTAPTGSGKSTQVPQMLLRHGFLDRGQVVILQPRRIAARLLAARVAEELGVPLGREVGYQVRFENVSGPQTKIKFVTEGILLRQLPNLDGVAALIFDEFHERHLYGDVTLARAVDLGIPILVMSATLDVELLENYLRPCAVVRSEGRMHPVKIEHAPGKEAADVLPPEGDVLIFQPGAYDIHRTIESIRPRAKGAIVLPLHGELSPRDQDAAVARYDRRKIVVATNVAETSITIDGITTVIDSGLARIARYDPRRGINTLWIEKISRASADQRAGRAGRTAPGTCIRLWPERESRPAREEPEVKRLDLSEVVLTLRASGIRDLRWIEPPPEASLAHAEELLTDLGALEKGEITAMGRRMLAFPMHPRSSRMLLAAQEFRCVPEAARVAAILQGRDLRPRSEERTTSDFWRLEPPPRELAQILRIAEAEGLDVSTPPAPESSVRRCILIGYSDRVAKRLDRGTLRCAVVHGRTGVLARESAVRDAEYFVAAEIREVEGKDLQTILSLATEIDPAWLFDLRERSRVEYDPRAEKVVSVREICFRDLVIETKPGGAPPPEEAARLLAANVRLRKWDEAVEQWILRVNFVARTCPELGIAPIGEADRRIIAEQVCHGAMSAREVEDRPVLPVAKSWAQPALVEKHAPERLELPTGKKPKVTYAADAPPFVQIRIQDLFDVRQIPKLAMGRVAPLVHILGPNQRPVQITQDLAGFWREHYPKIKKELQRKYPRHEWREM